MSNLSLVIKTAARILLSGGIWETNTSHSSERHKEWKKTKTHILWCINCFVMFVGVKEVWEQIIKVNSSNVCVASSHPQVERSWIKSPKFIIFQQRLCKIHKTFFKSHVPAVWRSFGAPQGWVCSLIMPFMGVSLYVWILPTLCDAQNVLSSTFWTIFSFWVLQRTADFRHFLSPQSKPLIPLQKEEDPETHKTVLTNYMFPQQTSAEECEWRTLTFSFHTLCYRPSVLFMTF